MWTYILYLKPSVNLSRNKINCCEYGFHAFYKYNFLFREVWRWKGTISSWLLSTFKFPERGNYACNEDVSLLLTLNMQLPMVVILRGVKDPATH